MILTGALLIAQSGDAAKPKQRKDIEAQFRWDLTDIYPSDQAWEQAKTQLIEDMDKVSAYRGKLDSAEKLLNCLKLQTHLEKEFLRLYSYAHMSSDQDVRESKYLSMTQEMIQLQSKINSEISFIEPEILQMDKSTIDRFIAREEGLATYEFYLNDLQRLKKHTLTPAEEKLLAEASLMNSGPGTIFNIFSNAELPYPTITLSDGDEVLLNASGYGRYRASANRSDRERVFAEFFSTLKKFANTFGAQLGAHVNTHIFNMRARGYSSCLEASLDRHNIPTAVYLNLVKNANDNLDSFHRYLTLKKRMLGVDTLKYSDIYAPAVKGLDMEYHIDEAIDMVLSAMEPLGKDYVRVVQKAIRERWVDVYPTEGKRAGAYSAGDVYDVHPYILLNFTGLYHDVSTYAHELGHTMQSYLSNKNQPFELAQYPIFTAEVASTLNEHLLMHKQLGLLKDDKLQLTLLMNFLDSVKGTVFRQAQFAEFELEMHKMAERGEPLTGENLSRLYGDILKKYYGHAKNICRIDDLYAIEWAMVPHFYYNFYVYQYATSYAASTALSEKILAGEPGATEKYINFLSAGGSDYPIALLKKAGVDMTTTEPFDKTVTAMQRAMKKMEEILNRVE